MQTRTLLILSYFLYATNLGFTQGGYIRNYAPGQNGTSFGNILVYQDTLIVHGLILSTTTPRRQGIIFMKLDTLGEVLYSKTYFNNNGKNYYLAGTQRSLVKYQDNSGYLFWPIIGGEAPITLRKLDNNGEIIWEKKYPDSVSLLPSGGNIYETDDGFIIAGSIQTIRSDFDIKILKINKEGDLKWSEIYGDPVFLDGFASLNPYKDNGYLIGNGVQPWRISSEPEWYQTKLFWIDSLGKVLKEWEFPRGLEENGTFTMLKKQNGNWVYITTREEYIPGSSLILQQKLIERDTDFNLIAEHTYGEPGYIERWGDFIPMSDGGYVAVGQNYLEYAIPRPGDLATWIVRLDEEGDTLWTHTNLIFPDSQYAYYSEQALHSVVELPSGSIVASGYYVGQTHFPDWGRGILIKVDRNGCLDTLLCPPISSLINPLVGTDKMTVFPNPSDSRFVFELDSGLSGLKDKHLLIYDYTGKIVERCLFPDNEESIIWAPQNLPSGLYIYQLSVAGQILQAGKLIYRH